MKNKTYIWLTVAISQLVLVSVTGAQDEQWLQYHTSGEARQVVGDMSQQRPELSAEKPAGVKLPDFKGKEPLFARWSSPMVKNGNLWIALDNSHKHGPCDRLFIDSNGDGNLNDETSTTAHRTENNRTYFGPVKVVFEGEDGPITYHLNFEFYSRENRNHLYLMSGCWYEGVITVGQEKKHCVLIDYNANGTFDDKSINAHECDRILIGKKDSRDMSFAGNYIEVDGQLCRLEIARDGAYIKLSKAEDVIFGNIRMPETITEFAAGGENGLLFVRLEKGAGKLPVGKYRIHHWAIEREDEKGKRWKLQGSWFREKGDFDVSEAGEVFLTVGEPVIGSLRVQQSGKSIDFDKELRGSLGGYLTLTRNGRRMMVKMHVKNKDGTFDRTYNLEDG